LLTGPLDQQRFVFVCTVFDGPGSKLKKNLKLKRT
jgi:hypothetical protein